MQMNLSSFPYSRLSDKDLLGMVVSEQCAERLFSRYGNLKEVMMDAFPEELAQIHGIGKARANQLKAIAELSFRLRQSPQQDIPSIRSPQDVYQLMSDLQFLKVEQFWAIYLNTKNRIIHKEMITQGTINSTVITPREVFSIGVKTLAASVILCHNHPTGQSEPSREDIEVTKRMKDAGKTLAIEVLDHVIIGSGNFYSLKEKGHFA